VQEEVLNSRKKSVSIRFLTFTMNEHLTNIIIRNSSFRLGGVSIPFAADKETDRETEETIWTIKILFKLQDINPNVKFCSTTKATFTLAVAVAVTSLCLKRFIKGEHLV
jgi:hypothetical protein